MRKFFIPFLLFVCCGYTCEETMPSSGKEASSINNTTPVFTKDSMKIIEGRPIVIIEKGRYIRLIESHDSCKAYLERKFLSIQKDTVKILKVGVARMSPKNSYALYGYGPQDGSSRVIRVELLHWPNGNGDTIAMIKKNGIIETCTGFKCEECNFGPSGACECSTGMGFCNHAIKQAH